MLLKSLKLRNIRSYESQVIEFPTGSTLLAGDIGTGKSTILLAIEFALFGTKRKHLSAASLLRHGKKEGDVELKFDLDGKEIIVKRRLKRGKDDIKQESGYIITNCVKKEGTHVELKTDILRLLGYPQDLVSKSRDLVYRYTVYTPQEQMKQIILEDKDVRLDTLRKVFNIDKYKKIRENSQIFIRDLKEKKKKYEGQIEDLDEKKKLKDGREKEIIGYNEKLNELLPKLNSVKELVNSKKVLIQEKEKQINNLNKLKKELELEELRLKNYLEKRKSNTINIGKLDEEISLLNDELTKVEIKDVEVFSKLLKEKEDKLGLLQNSILDINRRLSEFETKIRHSNETKEKISDIDQCPVCLQNVTDDHKNSINEREGKNISEFEVHMKLHKEKELGSKNEIDIIKKEIIELRKKQVEVKAIIVMKESLKDKESRKKLLVNEQELMKKEIGQINVRKMELSGKLDGLNGIEEDYKVIRGDFDKIQLDERRLEINRKELEVKVSEISKLVKVLGEEINKKLGLKSMLGKMSQYQNWLDEYFISLMNTMEKHVMLQVYAEFNDLFQQWFNALIEDETLNVRLDDEFTPYVEQNGYETSIDNLSGGEKTAVALAYRLALNKVINDIVGEMKTKDILMLDEPTDGFSSEQLDKIRVVLEDLGIKQVLIVSHESKIESFVDNVIRVNKDEHISEVT
jgi:exonuclease SbcC